MVSLGKMALGVVRDIAECLDMECSRFCPHMPRLKVTVEGESVDIALTNVDRVACNCSYRGVSKESVIRRCEAGRQRFIELESFYETCRRMGFKIPIPPDFFEKYNTFVYELYINLGIPV